MGEVLLKVNVTQDHPVDLYFVMDLSQSMSTYKDDLVLAATGIAEQIKETTTLFRLGFGSFSDKPTAPFAGN